MQVYFRRVKSWWGKYVRWGLNILINSVVSNKPVLGLLLREQPLLCCMSLSGWLKVLIPASLSWFKEVPKSSWEKLTYASPAGCLGRVGQSCSSTSVYIWNRSLLSAASEEVSRGRYPHQLRCRQTCVAPPWLSAHMLRDGSWPSVCKPLRHFCSKNFLALRKTLLTVVFLVWGTIFPKRG